METISLKMEKNLLNDIDKTLKENRYATRTEFIRDAIRHKLSDAEKEAAIKKLEQYKGFLKGKAKSNMDEEEAGDLAFQEIAKRLGVKLD